MKVRDLIEKLKEFDQDSLVVLNIDDGEGNAFANISDHLTTIPDGGEDETKKCVVIWL